MLDTALAFISPGVVGKQTFATVVNQGPFGGVISMGGAQRIRAMDEGIRSFLASDLEWWFQVDTDLEFPPDALRTLRAFADETDAKIVSGLYFDDKFGSVKPIYGAIDPEGRGPMLKPYDIRPWVDTNEVVQVDFVPEGCLLVHRSIFEAVGEAYKDRRYPWFYETLAEHEGVNLWEEATFLLRAKEVTGERPWVHHGVVCGHVKQRVITYETYQEGFK